MKLLALPPALVLLTFSTQVTVTSLQPNTIGDYVNRAIELPSFHPDEAPPTVHPDDPTPEEIIPSGTTTGHDEPIEGGVPSGTEGGLTSGSGGTEGGLTSQLSANDIPYEPASSPNPCLSGQCEDVSEEVSQELVDKLADLLNNVVSPGSSSAASTTILAPTRLGNSSTRPTIYPNADIATSLVSTGLSQPYMALLDSDEQSLYIDSPICFFANALRIYLVAASASQIITTTIPSPTARRRDASSTIAPSATASLASQFFATDLPQQILSLYSQRNETLETHATTCTGFDGKGAYVMSFVQRAEAVATSASLPTGTMTGDAGRVRVASLLVVTAGILVGIITGVFWL